MTELVFNFPARLNTECEEVIRTKYKARVLDRRVVEEVARQLGKTTIAKEGSHDGCVEGVLGGWTED